MKTLLTKSRKTSTIELNGDAIIIRELSLTDSTQIKQTGDDEATATLRLIVASIVDEQGTPVYSDADLPALRNVGLTTLKTLANAISELNELNELDEKKNK